MIFSCREDKVNIFLGYCLFDGINFLNNIEVERKEASRRIVEIR